MTAPTQPSFSTKRKALRSQVLQQIDMFDRLADPLLQISRTKGRIKWANQAAHELLGPDLTNRRLSKVFQSSALKDALRALRKSEAAQVDHIISAKNLPGRDFRMRLVRLEKKTVYGARVLVTLADITHILRLQSQRADFVANASHELKTPVAALAGFIETLESDPAALPTFLPLMAGETRRMRALINDLLNLARTEMETGDAPQHLVEILPLIHQAAASLKSLFDQHSHSLANTIDLPTATVRGDATALTTVLTNLLENAAKYAPKGSEIGLSATATQTQIHIHIRNPGPGIDQIHLPRLTERFYRVDDGRAPGAGGTGLGLAIVKHVLIRHGGELLISSSPGKGACFTVVLPLSTAPDPSSSDFSTNLDPAVT